MSALMQKIRSRGYWQVTVRPATFAKERVQYSDLEDILRRASVDLRGWDFPHIDPQAQAERGVDWIGQETEWSDLLEAWRFHQSGLFLDLAGLWSDWRDQSVWFKPSQGWQPGRTLGIGEVAFRAVEIFEFAARLAVTNAGGDMMHIGIEVHGLKGRILVNDDPRRIPLFRPYTTSLDYFPYSIETEQTALVGKARDLAVEPVAQLFDRFGWHPGAEHIRAWQDRIGKV